MICGPIFSRNAAFCAGLLVTTCIVALSDLPAQEARYELGRRLKRFEQRWEIVDKQSRARSTAWVEKAVSSFFSLQLLEAGRSLDQATMALEQSESIDAATAWVLSRRITAEPLLSDVQQAELNLKLDAFYSVDIGKGDLEPLGKVQFSIYPLADRGQYALGFERSAVPVKQSQWLDRETLEQGWAWLEFDLAEGDYMLVATVLVDGQPVDLGQCVISRIENLDSRLTNALKEADRLRKEQAPSTGIATMRSHLVLIESIRDGLVQETDYPVEEMLSDVEKLIAADGKVEAILDSQFVGDTWVTLARGRQLANVRLRVPQKQQEAFPVLFLFHGAGGSENMFFETYGAGRAVELAAERGWFVVAPRQRLLGGLGLRCGEMIEELAKYFPIDRSRIMFCGHSMGAMQATQQAVQAPELPVAVVALGGGGRIGAGELGSASWFVAAGDKDFGKPGAKSLADALLAKGQMVQWKEYPETEHMVIVQAALDDVFGFFENALQ